MCAEKNNSSFCSYHHHDEPHHHDESSLVPQQWLLRTLEEGLEWERWGQRIEANKKYQLLLKEIRNKQQRLSYSHQEDLKEKLAECEGILLAKLSSTTPPDHHATSTAIWITEQLESNHLDSFARLKQILQLLPCSITNVEISSPTTMDHNVTRPHSITTADHQVMITIDRIRVQDPDWINQPFITISVQSIKGPIEPPYDTEYSTYREGKYIIFRKEVVLKTSLSQIPEGSTILFELKHYNPSRRCVTVKNTSVLDIKELTEGPMRLESKSTGYFKRRLNILFRRKFYLYIKVTYVSLKT